MNCRICTGKNLYKFLDLGFMPPADQFRRKDQLAEPDIYYPLEVFMCEDCGLAQLGIVVSPEVLYRNDYPYEASITAMGRAHWNEFAASVVTRFRLGGKDLVVDIGSNVGVLLEAFKAGGVEVQGVDPAANIVLIAQQRGIETVCDFFNKETTERILRERGQASVVTATNVVAHVDDIYAFMRNINALLTHNGTFIFEVPYFANLLKKNEYDTIYHEHLSYFLLRPLVLLFSKFGMQIIDVMERDIHGGSIRVFVSRAGSNAVSDIVKKMLKEEENLRPWSRDVLDGFADRVRKNKRELVWLLQSLKHEGKRIAAVSAPAKGMTLLNYCRIDGDILEFVTEKSTLKTGRVTPGAHIQVVSDDELVARKIDYALLLAWNFAEEIMNNLKEFRAQGGRFIIPIPTPKVI